MCCNNGIGFSNNNNCWWWIIILILLFCNCGGNSWTPYNNGCNDNCNCC